MVEWLPAQPNWIDVPIQVTTPDGRWRLAHGSTANSEARWALYDVFNRRWFILLSPGPVSANALIAGIGEIAGQYSAEQLVAEVQIVGLPVG